MRLVPIAAVSIYLVAGMLLTLFLETLRSGHVGIWRTPEDFWTTYQSAVDLAHGHFSQIYSPATTLVTFPGISFALAPAAAVTSSLHWGLGRPISSVSAPLAWLVAGPVMLLLSSVPVFAADNFARRWEWPPSRRVLLAATEALLLANVTLLWGHPEDAISVGVVLYAALAVDDGARRRAGLLLGVALAVQPLALLAVPAVVARLSWRQVARLVPLVAVPVVLVILGPLLAEPHALWHAVFEQPNYPSANHATPWTSLARHVANGGVEAGPSRVVALCVTTIAAAVVCRRRPGLEVVVWVTAAAFLVRLCFEVVIDDYYLWPVLAVACIVAGRRSTATLWAFAVFALSMTGFQYASLGGVWLWWCCTITPLVLVTASLYPPRPARGGSLSGLQVAD